MTERSCVYKFVQHSQTSFERGETLPQVLSQADQYQRMVRRAYGNLSPLKRPIHRIGTSKIGLSTIAIYEYGRYKGIPLPDANTVIQTAVPLKAIRRAICGGEVSKIDRQELIDF
jgi:hypothetical protein